MRFADRASLIGQAWIGLVLATALPAQAEIPSVNYMLQCQGCHLPDGVGTPGSVPPLTGFVGKFLRVPHGREYLVRVPGSAQSPLSDRELAELLNWLVRRFGPEAIAADFVPFTEVEVAGYRDPPLTHVARMRSELLRQIELREMANRVDRNREGEVAR